MSFRDFLGLEFEDGADLAGVSLSEAFAQLAVVPAIHVPRVEFTGLGRRPIIETSSYLCTTDKIKSIVNG